MPPLAKFNAIDRGVDIVTFEYSPALDGVNTAEAFDTALADVIV